MKALTKTQNQIQKFSPSVSTNQSKMPHYHPANEDGQQVGLEFVGNKEFGRGLVEPKTLFDHKSGVQLKRNAAQITGDEQNPEEQQGQPDGMFRDAPQLSV
jgi:hypothetical protein